MRCTKEQRTESKTTEDKTTEDSWQTHEFGDFGRRVSAKRFSDLVAWQKAMNLVEEVYKVTKQFPREETYGLVSQLRRAAVSVPSNIAEGHGRTGAREFNRCLSIAHGSLCEVETQMEIARPLGYVNNEQHDRISVLACETGKIMNGLMNALERHAAAN